MSATLFDGFDKIGYGNNAPRFLRRNFGFWFGDNDRIMLQDINTTDISVYSKCWGSFPDRIRANHLLGVQTLMRRGSEIFGGIWE